MTGVFCLDEVGGGRWERGLGLEKVRGTSLNTLLGKRPSPSVVGGEPPCLVTRMPVCIPLPGLLYCFLPPPIISWP